MFHLKKIFANLILHSYRFFHRKVVLDWPKPEENCATSSKKLRKLDTIVKLNQSLFTPTRDITESENDKIILV